MNSKKEATLFDNLDSVRNTLVDKYLQQQEDELGDWGLDFKGELIYSIIDYVINQARTTRIFPASNNVFRCFKECKDLKVVFVGQDPYYQNGVADGLAFSCGLTLKEQPSLKFIYDEVLRTTGNITRNPDLTHWARQGVLLMNTALTVEQSKPDSHTTFWKGWIADTLQRISKNNDKLVFVFFGKRAQGFMGNVSDTHHKISVVHPAAAAHRGGIWDCEDLFNRVNQYLKQSNKREIIW